jgi:hypothetical protein
MKHILASIFIALLSASLARAVQVGEPESELVREWGKPAAVRTKPDGAQVWKYRDGTTVWVANNLVQKIEAPNTENIMQRSGAPATVVATPRKNSATRTTSAATLAAAGATKNSAKSASHAPEIGYFLMLGGLGVICISKVWFWIIALRSGTWWILGCFVPLISLIFVYLYWRDTRKAFAWQACVAFPLLVVGLYLTPIWSALEQGGISPTTLQAVSAAR